MTPRSHEILQDKLERLRARANQIFFWLFLAQWMVAVNYAVLATPRTWAGLHSSVHPHVWMALGLGGLISVFPMVLLRCAPRWPVTRQIVAVSQMLWSALLIHLSGGRIETHFHVFGSLAFLAFYRDWALLLTATVTVAIDHLALGLLWPESVYGIANPEWWRFLEHAGWLLFEDVILFLGCRRDLDEMRLGAEGEETLERLQSNAEQLVVERTVELERSMKRYRALVENTNSVPQEFDLQTRRVTYIAPQAAEMFRCDLPTIYGPGGLRQFYQPADRDRMEKVLDSIPLDQPWPGTVLEMRGTRGDGQPIFVHILMSPRLPGAPLQSLILDITQRKKLELDLQQAQKLEAVGRLASGVAHEINTPVQFVSDSLHFIEESFAAFGVVLPKLREVQDLVLAAVPAGPAALAARKVWEEQSVDDLVERVPLAMQRTLEGLRRITGIVRSMKDFAHPDSVDAVAVDLNRAIESTLTISRSEYKYVAEVETRLGELPPVTCRVGDVNQAVLNIVVNAAHAIGDRVKGTMQKGKIVVSTRAEAHEVVIAIADDGGGIPEEIRDRIFDPFFTTKEVGRGTGQGLAISRTVIVERHGGQLTFESEMGKGTTFFIRLPITGKKTRVAHPIAEAKAA